MEILEQLAGTRFSCSCGCCGKGYTKPTVSDKGFEFDRLFVIRLLIASILFAVALIFKNIPEPWPLVMLMVSVVAAGYDIIAAAILALMRRNYFDRCILIFAASVLAFAIGQGAEGAALILLFQLGGALIDYAFTRTRQNIIAAVTCDAATARLVTSGVEEEVPAESLKQGDRIVIFPGERVPCDCIVLEGNGNIDLSPLGGGGEPVFVAEGDEIFSGCIVIDNNLRCEATATQADSTAAILRRSVKSSFDCGDPVPKSVRRFFELYTPVLVVISVLIACLLPLIYKIGIIYSIKRALVFLVIANPCAMLAALPLIRLCATAKAAINGILFSDTSVMEKTAHSAAVIFDKPGTLTEGSPRVVSIKSERMDADILLKITAHALAYSNSTLARSVIASYGGTIYIELIDNFKEIPKMGVEVTVDGVRICAGNLKLMEERAIMIPAEDVTDEQAVYVSIATEYAGRILLAEGLRADAAAGVADLSGQGVDAVIMLTDEKASTAVRTATELGIREYYSGYGREQKLSTIGEIKRSISPRDSLVFVWNKKSLGREHTSADVDVSMCDIQELTGSSSSDITIFSGRVTSIAAAIGAAKQSELFAYITMAGVLLIKLAVLVLAFIGLATPWFAMFIDSAAALGAILCSIFVFNSELPSGRRFKPFNR